MFLGFFSIDLRELMNHRVKVPLKEINNKKFQLFYLFIFILPFQKSVLLNCYRIPQFKFCQRFCLKYNSTCCYNFDKISRKSVKSWNYFLAMYHKSINSINHINIPKKPHIIIIFIMLHLSRCCIPRTNTNTPS